MRTALSRNPRRWLIGTLLIALVARALIPAGFMPATDRPLSFQICPDGFPAHMLRSAHAGHGGHHLHDTPNAHAAAAEQLDVAHEHGAADESGARHQHSSISAEHCVFAAAAGAGPLAFAATFSAPVASLDAPDVPYVSTIVERQRFRIQQPRGPPTLS
jgi:hypothetical protein